MPSSYTTSNRFEEQATGENSGTWGAKLITGLIRLVEDALEGWVSPISSDTTLTTVNGAADQARKRILKATAAVTITIPTVRKWYIVWASSGDVVITNGSSSVTVKSGDIAFVITDGTTVTQVQRTDFGGARLKNIGTPTATTDAVTKAYADALAFNSVDLPAQTGNAGKFVQTDGTNASWEAVEIADVSGLQTALDAKAVAADVYLKTETYSDTETDNLLDAKADAADTYTKAEVDAAIAAGSKIKAWAFITGTTVLSGSNIASVSGSGGSYTIAFTSAMPTANYAVFPQANGALGLVSEITSQGTGSFNIETRTPAGTAVEPDLLSIQVIHA